MITEPQALARKKTASRTAVVFAEYFPPYMGSDRRIFDLVRNCASWNIEFAVVPPLRILGGRCESALTEYFQRHFIEGVVEDESGGLHGHYFTLPPPLMRAWRRFGLPVAYGLTVPFLVAAAVRHLKARKPDVVIVAHPSYLCGAVGLFAAKIAAIPALLDYPDAWTPLAIETAGIRPGGMTANILRFLEGVIARRARRIVSITAGLTSYIRALGVSAPVSLVGNGADATMFDASLAPLSAAELRLPEGSEIILYSGRLETWSGVHEIVDTIDTVCSARERARFVFVGDGSAADSLVKEIHGRGLSDKVSFLGFRRFAQMPKIVASASVAIVPFPDTPTTRVCSPVKLFEYMLMKKPIITTDLPGIREAVSEQHVTFVRTLSAPEMSEAILSLLSNPRNASAVADRAYNLALSEFTWQELAIRFEEVLEHVYASKNPAALSLGAV